jgi:hypothetical protein
LIDFSNQSIILQCNLPVNCGSLKNYQSKSIDIGLIGLEAV